MENRNVSFHKGYHALFVVNPNNTRREEAKLVIGFHYRELEDIVAWLEAFNPKWWDPKEVTDDEIREHSLISLPRQE